MPTKKPENVLADSVHTSSKEEVGSTHALTPELTANSDSRWIVGISGASGTRYARRLLQVVAQHLPQLSLDVVISEGAFRVLQEEEQLHLSSRRTTVEDLIGFKCERIALFNNRDTGAAIASGSHRVQGMIVVPCSMNSLAAIATGYSDNLLRRAADVTLKESRRLILVPRETPLHTGQLEHLLQLSKRGVVIAPAMPGFYHRPESIAELIDMVVMRLLDQMGFTVSISLRWKEGEMYEQDEVLTA